MRFGKYVILPDLLRINILEIFETKVLQGGNKSKSLSFFTNLTVSTIYFLVDNISA